MNEIDRLTQEILEGYREEMRLLLDWRNGNHEKLLRLFAEIKDLERDLIVQVGDRKDALRMVSECYRVALQEAMPAYVWGWVRR